MPVDARASSLVPRSRRTLLVAAALVALAGTPSVRASAPFANGDDLRAAVGRCLDAVPSGSRCCSSGAADCGAAGTADMPAWDVSLVADVSFLFDGRSHFAEDIAAWDVSGVEDARFMFRGASSFDRDIVRAWRFDPNLPRSAFEGMFEGAVAWHAAFANCAFSVDADGACKARRASGIVEPSWSHDFDAADWSQATNAPGSADDGPPAAFRARRVCAELGARGFGGFRVAAPFPCADEGSPCACPGGKVHFAARHVWSPTIPAPPEITRRYFRLFVPESGKTVTPPSGQSFPYFCIPQIRFFDATGAELATSSDASSVHGETIPGANDVPGCFQQGTSYDTSYDCRNAFNGVYGPYYCSSEGVSHGYVGYYFGSDPVTVATWEVTFIGGYGGVLSPTEWWLESSDDGVTWTMIEGSGDRVETRYDGGTFEYALPREIPGRFRDASFAEAAAGAIRGFPVADASAVSCAADGLGGAEPDEPAGPGDGTVVAPPAGPARRCWCEPGAGTCDALCAAEDARFESLPRDESSLAVARGPPRGGCSCCGDRSAAGSLLAAEGGHLSPSCAREAFLEAGCSVRGDDFPWNASGAAALAGDHSTYGEMREALATLASATDQMGCAGLCRELPRGFARNALGGDPNAFLFAHLVADDLADDSWTVWPDRSGHGNDFVPYVEYSDGSDRRPTLVLGADGDFGGYRRSVRFGRDSSGGAYMTAAALVDGKTLRFSASEGTFGATFFVVAKLQDMHYSRVFDCGGHTEGGYGFYLDPGNDTTVASTKITTPTDKGGQASPTNIGCRACVSGPQVFAVRFAVSDGDRTVKNGKQELWSTVGNRDDGICDGRLYGRAHNVTTLDETTIRFDWGKFKLGAQAKGMSRTSRYMKGDIAEFRAYRGALSDRDVRAIMDELEEEYVFGACLTEAACRASAIERGLTLGGAGSAFAGDYAVKGCHAYTQWATTAEWRGAAFFGTGGGETDVEAEFGEDARATDSPQNERVRLRCTAEHNAATR